MFRGEYTCSEVTIWNIRCIEEMKKSVRHR